MHQDEPVLVLLSGGIDSAAALALAVDSDRATSALFVDFGQPAAVAEAAASQAIARSFGVRHQRIALEGCRFRGGEILGRNAWLVHTALFAVPSSKVIVLGIHAGTRYRDFAVPSSKVIVLGIHAGTRYRDCSSEFVTLMQRSFDFHTGGTTRVAAPFLQDAKSAVFDLAVRLSVPLEATYSCECAATPCHRCLSCLDRDALLARA